MSDNLTVVNTSVVAVIDNMTTRKTVPDAEESNHVLAYILVPLGSLAIVAIIAFVVSQI